MDYSVWDYHQKRFDYYRAAGEEPATGSFRTPVGGLECPERALPVLPASASRTGCGQHARGQIAVTESGLARLLGGQASSAVDGSGGSIQGLGDVGEPSRGSRWLYAAGAMALLWWGAGS